MNCVLTERVAASRSTVSATSMPSAGAHTIATRLSMTDSNSGFSASSAQGPGRTTSVSGMRNSGPRERKAAATAVNASALTRACSHSRMTIAKARATSGQP